MIAASRRSFITGLVALVAAPAIVRAGSLMAVNSGLAPGDSMLMMNQITREAVRLFENSNKFIENLPPYEPGHGPAQIDVLYGVKGSVGDGWSSEECRAIMERQIPYESVFEASDAEIGRTLRIRLPNDYIVSDGPGSRLMLQDVTERIANLVFAEKNDPFGLSQIPDNLALAAAAVAIAPVVLAKPMTRRFWRK